MYYRAAALALSNNQRYHLAAILYRRGKVVAVGTNSDKTHPECFRIYLDGSWGAVMHAEMSVLRFSKPGDSLRVLRAVKASKEFTMARPCRFCQNMISEKGIINCQYTGWSGEWLPLSVDNNIRGPY